MIPSQCEACMADESKDYCCYDDEVRDPTPITNFFDFLNKNQFQLEANTAYAIVVLIINFMQVTHLFLLFGETLSRRVAFRMCFTSCIQGIRLGFVDFFQIVYIQLNLLFFSLCSSVYRRALMHILKVVALLNTTTYL